MVDNRKPAVKKKTQRKGRWKPGESGNPKGAPKRGESWAETIKAISDMTPAQAAEWCNQVAGKLKSIGDDVSLKQAVTLRVFAALMFDPQPGLFNAVMERTEGKVADRVEHSGSVTLIEVDIDGADQSQD